ncbi:pre-rRNA-processing protein [Xylaria longipes]|nr:pre-rRNA-processing protein [Xylaria longipes]
MPAPTAPLKPVVDDAPPTNVALPGTDDDQEFALDGMNDLPESSAIQAPLTAEDMEIVDEEDRPRFPQVQNDDGSFRIQSRKIPVPPHRFSPLKSNWPQIYPPLVEHLKLAVRMNVKQKAVELRNSKTSSPGALQKGEDFIRAFCLGFDVGDAIALLRLDDLVCPMILLLTTILYRKLTSAQYLETFEIKDVKTLTGDHLSRAIGRIAGNQGKTKFAIENASKTRVILADSKVHILGAFKNIQIARSSIVNLIRGKPPGKVYNNLRAVSARMKERF